MSSIGSVSGIQEVLSALLPALIKLCQDSVAAVRLAAGSQLGLTIARIDWRTTSGTAFDGDMITASAHVCQLASSAAFQHRQVYALAFESIAKAKLSETVLGLFWPAFATLVSDAVPNVRLAVCHTLLNLILRPKGGGDTDLRHGCTSPTTVAQTPVLDMALVLIDDSDQEVARVARLVVDSMS